MQNKTNMDWYVLRPTPNIVFNWKKLKDFALQRIAFLESFESPKAQAMDQEQTFLGTFMLYLAAASSLPIRSWVIETEGDYFNYMFRQNDSKIRVEVIKQLLGDHLSYSEFKSLYNGKYKSELMKLYSDVAVFRALSMPEMLSKKILFLHDGWAAVEYRFLFPFMKRKFEMELKNRIDTYKAKLERLPEEAQQFIKDLVKYLQSNHPQMHTSISEGIVIPDILGLPKLLPPCMRFLAAKMEKERYLGDADRLQLGLFLKNIGMSLDEQLEYWWSFSVDNVGMDRSTWDRMVKPRIKHMYGEIGSRTDYKAVKCENSSYFCPFMKLKQSDLTAFLAVFYMDIKDIEPIVKEANFRNNRRACKILFDKVVGNEYGGIIYSSISWAKLMKRLTKRE